MSGPVAFIAVSLILVMGGSWATIKAMAILPQTGLATLIASTINTIWAIASVSIAAHLLLTA